MRNLLAVFALSLFPALASAQTTGYSVAVFGSTATNPATATPIAPAVVYPLSAVTCGQPKVAETTPIVNPYEGRIDDPANAALDCAVAIEPQVLALPVGTGYKIAFRAMAGTTPSTWSPMSTPFSVAMQTTHPCDGTAATSGTVLVGNRTLSWCFNGLDTTGNPANVTSWAVYVDGVRSVLSGVTVGATANTAGFKLYQAPLTLAGGTHTVQVAGVNSVGEAVKSATFTVTVTVPQSAPSVSNIRGIQ